MMMMANHAEPLDNSCTNTKYMSWVWRKGLQGVKGAQLLEITRENWSFFHNVCVKFVEVNKHFRQIYSLLRIYFNAKFNPCIF